MRAAGLILLVALIGCGGGPTSTVDAAHGGPDGTPAIDAPPGTIDAPPMSMIDAPPGTPDSGLPFKDGGGPPLTCVPDPTTGCTMGVKCGGGCCGPGERCDPSTNSCHCGTGSKCTGGDTCASFGPVMTDGCGSICCGVSGPCPG
jgi:hypothetical protein